MRTQTLDWNPLGRDYLGNVAPASLAAGAKPGRSARYGYVSTEAIVDQLADLGYGVVAARQSSARVPERRDFGRHMVVLQRTSDPVDAAFAKVGKLVGVGDSVLRLMLVNSHDGRGALQFRLGFFRFVCSNTSMMPGASAFARSVRHTDLTLDAVVEAVRYLAGQHDAFRAMFDAMGKRELSPRQVRDFGQFGRRLRWDDDEDGPSVDDILVARRDEDDGRSVWKVVNRVQENLIRGGATYTKANKHGRRVERRARPIGAVKADIRINSALMGRASELVAA